MTSTAIADTGKTTTSTEGRDLILSRVIDAPCEKVFKAWTEPSLLKQWFAPLPWTISKVETDLKPGCSTVIVMRGPHGEEMPYPGVYLQVVKNKRTPARAATRRRKSERLQLLPGQDASRRRRSPARVPITRCRGNCRLDHSGRHSGTASQVPIMRGSVCGPRDRHGDHLAGCQMPAGNFNGIVRGVLGSRCRKTTAEFPAAKGPFDPDPLITAQHRGRNNRRPERMCW